MSGAQPNREMREAGSPETAPRPPVLRGHWRPAPGPRSPAAPAGRSPTGPRPGRPVRQPSEQRLDQCRVEQPDQAKANGGPEEGPDHQEGELPGRDRLAVQDNTVQRQPPVAPPALAQQVAQSKGMSTNGIARRIASNEETRRRATGAVSAKKSVISAPGSRWSTTERPIECCSDCTLTGRYPRRRTAPCRRVQPEIIRSLPGLSGPSPKSTSLSRSPRKRSRARKASFGLWRRVRNATASLLADSGCLAPTPLLIMVGGEPVPDRSRRLNSCTDRLRVMTVSACRCTTRRVSPSRRKSL